MENSCILAIDQGTSSTKTLIFDGKGQMRAKASVPLKTLYLEGGLVEQDPEAIYQNMLESVRTCILKFISAGGNINDIKTCGISNQRETFVIWDQQGRPLHKAIVWQCKRSVAVCEELKKAGLETMIRDRTGLIIDPYFSGTKVVWLYQNVDKVRDAIDNGNAYFGTIDTWLLYKLTKGKVYATDHTNASRTLFFNLNTLNWDREVLQKLGLQRLNTPAINASSSDFGRTDLEGTLPFDMPVTAMVGDSHAAAFGEGCFLPGTAKATLGTGCSILMNIGNMPKTSANGMVTTICWSTEERVDYALEGVIVSCGSTIEWLKNELGLFKDSKDTEAMADSVPDNNGVYIVPAFSGLGAPHWDMGRRAEICGLTFDCNKNHIVRAALEAIAFQIRDVVDAMEQDGGIELGELMLNGGMTANNIVLKQIATLLKCHVIKGDMPDVSAFGAGLLAGLKAGIFSDIEDIKLLKKGSCVVERYDNDEKIQQAYQTWLSYVIPPSHN